MIYVVGIGPGGSGEITPRARAALERCDVILGYKTYIELIAPLFGDKDKNKDIRPFSMTREEERCREALKLAEDGHTVGLVSGGDPGVYGMAGLMFEIAGAAQSNVEIEIVPGITAASAAAAVLGAPLTHDFAVISLSDLLTPRELIERRLDAAAYADFSVCIYNPSSHGRPEHFRWACDVLLRHKSPDTPAGWVRNAGRSDTSSRVMTLGTIRDEQLDMFCTAIIGNSQTVILNKNLMVTPRGYKI